MELQDKIDCQETLRCATHDCIGITVQRCVSECDGHHSGETAREAYRSHYLHFLPSPFSDDTR